MSKKGKGVAVILLGDFYQLGEKVVETLAKEKVIEVTLIKASCPKIEVMFLFWGSLFYVENMKDNYKR